MEGGDELDDLWGPELEVPSSPPLFSSSCITSLPILTTLVSSSEINPPNGNTNFNDPTNTINTTSNISSTKDINNTSSTTTNTNTARTNKKTSNKNKEKSPSSTTPASSAKKRKTPKDGANSKLPMQWAEYAFGPATYPVHDSITFQLMTDKIDIVIKNMNVNLSYSQDDGAWICYRQNQFKLVCLLNGPPFETLCVNDKGVPMKIEEMYSKIYALKEVAGLMGDGMRVGLHHMGKRRLKDTKIDIEMTPFTFGKIEFTNLQFEKSNSVKRSQTQTEFFHIVVALYAKCGDNYYHILSKICPKIIVRGQNPGFYSGYTPTVPRDNATPVNNSSNDNSPKEVINIDDEDDVNPPSTNMYNSNNDNNLYDPSTIHTSNSLNPPPNYPSPLSITSSSSPSSSLSFSSYHPPSTLSFLSPPPPTSLSRTLSRSQSLSHSLSPYMDIGNDLLPPSTIDLIKQELESNEHLINKINETARSNHANNNNKPFPFTYDNNNNMSNTSNTILSMFSHKREKDGWTRIEDTLYHHGRVGINTDNPIEALTVHGNVLATADIYKPSDQRIKTHLQRVNPQDQLGRIREVKIYDYSIHNRRERGVLAQELAVVMPPAVKILPGGDIRPHQELLVVDERYLLYENLGATQQLATNINNEKTNLSSLSSRMKGLIEAAENGSVEAKGSINFLINVLFKEEHRSHNRAVYDEFEEEFINFQFSVFRMGPARSLFILGHFASWLWVFGALFIFSNVKTRRCLGIFSSVSAVMNFILENLNSHTWDKHDSLSIVIRFWYVMYLGTGIIFATTVLYLNYKGLRRRKKDRDPNHKEAFWRYVCC